MNKDQVKGRLKTAKGQAKATTGKILGKKGLTEKGEVEKVVGNIQSGYGDIKEELKSDK